MLTAMKFDYYDVIFPFLTLKTKYVFTQPLHYEFSFS